MNVLLWHVHGSWTTSFVQGAHDYLLPVVPDRGPDGRGRATSWTWPPCATEVPPEELAGTAVDVVVLQRPRDETLANAWLGGRRVGRDVPAIWLEHNASPSAGSGSRHAAADRDDVTLVHVTHTNSLLWDSGSTDARVIEHGIVDPRYRYVGDRLRSAVVINEPTRRGRAVGCDLLSRIAEVAPLDLYGMDVEPLARALRDDGLDVVGHDDVPQCVLHHELARHRVYVHPYRWTSLGLSLLEAMHLGVPVAALATLEVPRAVPFGAGCVTASVDELCTAIDQLMVDGDRAAAVGRAGRDAALARYGLDRFLEDWDTLLKEVAA